MKSYYILLLLPLFLVMACGSEDENCSEERASLEEAIAAYNVDNRTVQTFTIDGRDDLTFQYIIKNPGGAARPMQGDTVTVNYRGTFTDNETVFDETDESGDNPIPLPLNNLIAGWQLGIPLIGEGGEIVLFLPARLAYGNRQDIAAICPNSDLVFEIELVSFTD